MQIMKRSGRRYGFVSFGAWMSVFALMSLLCACGGGEDKEPDDRQCTKNEDCGLGYVCQYQTCVCLLCGDEDEADIDTSDTEREPETEPEPDTADGDPTESETPDGDPEPEIDPDYDPDFPCTVDIPDPMCLSQSRNFCRNGQVQHSVYFCRDGGLWFCKQNFDCHYPTCGYVTSERRIKETCVLGCVNNPDPQMDDYCMESPPDGDPDTDAVETEQETPADGDSEADSDADADLPDHRDGARCQIDNDCILGHKCVPDMDNSAKYCAPAGKCVSHIGLAAEQLATIFNSGDRRCQTGIAWVQCLTSGLWGYPTECTRPKCEDVYFTPGQTCLPEGDNYASCDPPTLPDQAYCPGFFRCLNATYCRESCTLNTHCRIGYKCKYDPNTPDDPQNGTCIPVTGRRK